jgi:hypothetical protein
VKALWRALGRGFVLGLRGLFAVARAVNRIDRTFVAGIGEPLLSVGQAFAQAIARAHKGNAQDMTLLYLAGLALLLVGRLFGS